jgi:hypothetical protein
MCLKPRCRHPILPPFKSSTTACGSTLKFSERLRKSCPISLLRELSTLAPKRLGLIRLCSLCSKAPTANPELRSMSPAQSTTSSSAKSRLSQIKNQTMGSTASPSRFTADVVPKAAEDPLFGLMAAYRKDTYDKKVDLGIGAYRDDNAKPWVLPVVKKVRLAAV